MNCSVFLEICHDLTNCAPRHRSTGENVGLRIGTVRRPPLGAPKSEFASRNWYDVWLPDVSATPELMKPAKVAESEKDWQLFARKCRTQMNASEKSRLPGLLAALSLQTDLAIGCYREDESRCHRSPLRPLLGERGARLSGPGPEPTSGTR